MCAASEVYNFPMLSSVKVPEPVGKGEAMDPVTEDVEYLTHRTWRNQEVDLEVAFLPTTLPQEQNNHQSHSFEDPCKL